MADFPFSLTKHLAQEHQVSPFSTYLKEIVYGGTDGIITTFAVIAGFTGAQNNFASRTALPVLAVLLFGFANLFADGISMALGNFLSTRAEKDLYEHEKRKELSEITNNPQMEKQESEAILVDEGFTRDQAKTLVDIYATNPTYWLNFMMRWELMLPNPEQENSILMACATFVSFVFFGVMPMIPYVFGELSTAPFVASTVTALGALFLLGLLRWQITGQRWLRPIAETVLLGCIAGSVAYGVGMLFR